MKKTSKKAHEALLDTSTLNLDNLIFSASNCNKNESDLSVYVDNLLWLRGQMDKNNLKLITE